MSQECCGFRRGNVSATVLPRKISATQNKQQLNIRQMTSLLDKNRHKKLFTT